MTIKTNDELLLPMKQLEQNVRYETGHRLISAVVLVLQWDVVEDFLTYIYHFILTEYKHRAARGVDLPDTEFHRRANALLDDCLEKEGPTGLHTALVQLSISQYEQGRLPKDFSTEYLTTVERDFYGKKETDDENVTG